MSTIGHFLEFSVQTPNILESLHFYKSLGFTELESNDVYSHKYTVVSDGDQLFVESLFKHELRNLAAYAGL